MPKKSRPSDFLDGLPPPPSELPWSPDFVMQAIEILPVALRAGEIVSLRPVHAESFVVGWPAGAKPEEVAARSLAAIGMKPIVLHSTSWRHTGGEAVLTYLTVVPAETASHPDWQAVAVRRAELARGDATAPPPTIAVDQVLEHALRHLAWLLADDPAIAQSLPDWPPLLASYVPEPFRALGGPPSG